MSLFSILHSGSSAMGAASTALNTTTNNVANADTPGYARQSTTFTPAGTIRQNGILLGQGVSASAVTSSYNRFSQSQVFGRLGTGGYGGAQATDFQAIETIFAEGAEGGLGQAMTDFLDSFSELESSPSDPWVRLEVLARAEGLTSYFNRQANDLGVRQVEADQSVVPLVNQASSLAGQVGALNADIVRLEASGGTAHDLRSHRTALLEQLSDLGPTTVQDEADGSVTVLFAGHSIVEGANARTLSVGTDATTGFNTIRISQGTSSLDITSALGESGRLGSVINTRDVVTSGLLSQLDELAFDLAGEVNTLHSTGYGLDGVTGRDFFEAPTAQAGAAASFSLDAAVADTPDAIAASSSASTIPGGNDLATQLAALGEATVMSGSTQTFGQFYASVIAGVGQDAASAYSSDARAQLQLNAAMDLRDSASGVSLEEEALDLIRYREAFSAATRVISTANEMLDELMRIV